MATKIVIVEDDQAIASMYELKFTSEGFTVQTAANGSLGLALAEKMKPDIVLLDLMMPEMNGDEMLAKMRKTDWGKNIKVAVLTNIGESEIPPSIMKLNVATIITKAYHTPAQVVDMVKKVLSS